MSRTVSSEACQASPHLLDYNNYRFSKRITLSHPAGIHFMGRVLFPVLLLLAVPALTAEPSSTHPKGGGSSAANQHTSPADSSPAESSPADQAKARAIVEAAIKAHGGEAVLGKFVGGYCKVETNDFSDDKKIPRTFEMYIQGDDKMRLISYEPPENKDKKDADKKSKVIEVVNGKEGWYKTDDEPAVDIGDELEAEARERVHQLGHHACASAQGGLSTVDGEGNHGCRP